MILKKLSEFCRKQRIELAQSIGTQEGTINIYLCYFIG